MIETVFERNANYSQDNSLPNYGVWLESRTQRPVYKTVGHQHNCPSIIYVISGQGRVILGNNQYDLQANSVIPLEEKQIHELVDQPRKSMTIFSLYFSRKGMNQDILDFLIAENKPFILPFYYTEQVKRNLRQILYEQSHHPPGYALGIRQATENSILQLYRAKLQNRQEAMPPEAKSLERVQSTLDYIKTHYHEQHTLAEAARMAHVSQRQFTNLCRKISGSSFVQFINSYRCGRARILLKKTDMPVSAIAFEIGFEELSSFYRAFKKHQKQPPLTCRKNDFVK